ncbi:MAG: DNA integrity scanning protein DisA nucleotide-binding domain protein [Pirellula sp.]|jgi:diadenylate cyclase
MTFKKFTREFASVTEAAGHLAVAIKADAILFLLDTGTDWERLRELVPPEIKRILVAADRAEDLAEAEEHGLIPLVLNKEDSPLLERLQHALIEAVADELLASHCDVIAVYCGFEVNRVDSISIIRLDERMRRFTSRDLQRLESSVPLNTLKLVIDLAVQIGREGREGNKVGTSFIVGDTRKVLQHCKDSGFDPLKGYSRKNRNLHDPRVREDIKEIAQLDGAFVVSSDAIVERSRQILEVLHENLQLSKGLGSRHWAAAAISQRTKAISIVVSQSSGTVRVFQNGALVLRIEPMDQAVKWQEFNYETPAVEGDDK